MALNANEKYIRDRATVMSIVKTVLIVAVIGVLLFFATRVVSVLVPFLIGFLLAKTAHAIASPINKSLTRKHGFNSKRTKRIQSTVYGILIAVVIIAAAAGILTLIVQGTSVFTALQTYAVIFSDANKLSNFLWQFAQKNGGKINDSIIRTVIDYINANSSSWARNIPDLVTSAVSSIWSLLGNVPYGIFVVICVFMSGYYFISDGPNVLKMYIRSVPNQSFRRRSLDLINNLSVTLFRALGGYLLLLIITMVESWIAFSLAGVDYALVLAVVTAFLDFLPVLGISATMIPVIIYCIFHGNYTGAVILIIAMAIMTVIRRFIEPAIVGKSLHLHPLVMLISMALGVYTWGAVGFLLGPVIFIIILDIFKVFGFDKKLSGFLSQIISKVMKPAPAESEDKSEEEEE